MKKTKVNLYRIQSKKTIDNAEEHKAFVQRIVRAMDYQERLARLDPIEAKKNGELVLNTFGSIKTDEDIFIGTIAFVQTSNLPETQEVETKISEPLILKNGVGLKFPTSFLYDRKTNILAIHKLNPGVSNSDFHRFFCNSNDFKLNEIAFSVVPKIKTIEDVSENARITQFGINIADMENYKKVLDKDETKWEYHLWKIGHLLNVGKVKLKLEPKDGNLLSKKLIQTVRLFQKNKYPGIENLEIVASDEDYLDDTFNLVSKQLQLQIELDEEDYKDNRKIENEIYREFDLMKEKLRHLYAINS